VQLDPNEFLTQALDKPPLVQCGHLTLPIQFSHLLLVLTTVLVFLSIDVASSFTTSVPLLSELSSSVYCSSCVDVINQINNINN